MSFPRSMSNLLLAARRVVEFPVQQLLELGAAVDPLTASVSAAATAPAPAPAAHAPMPSSSLSGDDGPNFTLNKFQTILGDIQSALDCVTLQDVKLYVERGTAGWNGQVKCITLDSNSHYTLAIFYMRKGAVIPLHNHPGMTVFFKLLAGNVHYRSFDVVQPVPSTDSFLARVSIDGQFQGPAGCVLLHPTKGNIHSIRALSDVVFLDFMLPPYNPECDRDCAYYEEEPDRGRWWSPAGRWFGGGGHGHHPQSTHILKETPTPDWLRID